MMTVFLLGAGFTRAVFGDKAPLTDELISRLDICAFPEIREEYERTFPDIEQFLSILDLKILRLRQINKSLSVRFDKIRENIVQQVVSQVDIGKLHVDNLCCYPILRKFIEIVPNNSRILTLNYDCVLDQGLYLSKRWSPRGGYLLSSFPSNNDENELKHGILLLKLHGSCNFRENDYDKDYPDIEINDRIFTNISADLSNRNSPLSNRPHVVVMSYIKQFHNGIMRLWREAVSSLKEAEKLVVVGCSLREEDTFLRFALYHFGMKKNTDKFHIDIIDIEEQNTKKIEEKITRLVANRCCQKVELFHDGLESYLNNKI